MPLDQLDAVLSQQAAIHPERVAYTFEGESLTYAALLADAERLAGRLTDAGVVPGARVALVLPAGLDFVRWFWAVQRAGAASCAINPATPHRAALVQPHALVSSEGVRVEPAAPGRRLDLAFVQPTSGTSGEPRAVMIRQSNILAVLRSAAEAVQLNEHDIFVSWVPPWHDLGLVRFVIAPVYAGATCHIVTPAVKTIPQWLAKISAVRGTISGAPDFAYRLATRVDPTGLDLTSLRYVTNGGEPVRSSTIAAFEERFGIPGVVRPGYGLAEATLGVTTLRPGEPMRIDARGHVSCGRPLPGVDVRIEHDEILVRGAGVFAGYFDAENPVRPDGWLPTGDTGYLDADHHLYVFGRKRAMLKRGGVTLAPRELEEAAYRVAGVRLAAAVEHEGEITVAVEGEVDASDVRREVHRAVGFNPSVVLLPPRTIPLTANGKVRHAALRERLNEVRGSSVSS